MSSSGFDSALSDIDTNISIKKFGKPVIHTGSTTHKDFGATLCTLLGLKKEPQLPLEKHSIQ